MLLMQAIVRLFPVGIEALKMHLEIWHWIALVIIITFMAYSEGYKAFQKAFCPRVASRARHLSNNPYFFHVLLAPAFCMGFFHATKKRIIISVCITLGVIILILLVRMAPQPWRGIIDLGVVVGLSWGVVALLYFTIRAFMTTSFEYPPDLPDNA